MRDQTDLLSYWRSLWLERSAGSNARSGRHIRWQWTIDLWMCTCLSIVCLLSAGSGHVMNRGTEYIRLLPLYTRCDIDFGTTVVELHRDLGGLDSRRSSRYTFCFGTTWRLELTGRCRQFLFGRLWWLRWFLNC